MGLKSMVVRGLLDWYDRSWGLDGGNINLGCFGRVG